MRKFVVALLVAGAVLASVAVASGGTTPTEETTSRPPRPEVVEPVPSPDPGAPAPSEG